MTEWSEQGTIDAPAEDVWRLVGNPARYPEWWPRFVEVRGERFEEGTEFVQVMKTPFGREETVFKIDRMDSLREIHMHCAKSGLFAHWLLTDAQGGTFVEIRAGVGPIGGTLERTLARVFFRRWAADSLEALGRTVRSGEPEAGVRY
jgi:Polyketide cyclase / dehydrase and lipid transport